jgi:hypothetical protein
MKYKFYVEFLRNKTKFAIIAWLIQLTIKRKYNHVEIVCVPEYSDFPVLYYGAVSPVLRQTFLPKIREKYEIVKRCELKKQIEIADLDIIKYCNSHVGIKYAFYQNLMLLFMASWSYLKKALSGAVLNQEKQMNCVEFVSRVMVDCFGYKIATSFDAVEFQDILNSIDVYDKNK